MHNLQNKHCGYSRTRLTPPLPNYIAIHGQVAVKRDTYSINCVRKGNCCITYSNILWNRKGSDVQLDEIVMTSVLLSFRLSVLSQYIIWFSLCGPFTLLFPMSQSIPAGLFTYLRKLSPLVASRRCWDTLTSCYTSGCVVNLGN